MLARDLSGRFSFKKLILEFRTFLILVVICIVFSLLKNTFYNPINLMNIVKRSVYIAVVSFSTTLMLTQGNLDISVGGTAAMIGCIAAIGLQKGAGLPAAIMLCLICGAAAGLLIGVIAIKGRVETFLVALAMKYVYTGIAYLLTGGIPVPITDPTFKFIFGTQNVLGPIPFSLIIFIVTFLIAWFIYKKTKYGYYLRAIGSNVEAAKVAGISTDWVKICTFIINGAFAAISGMLLAGQFAYGSPTVGTELAMDAIAAVVLGGSAVSGGKGKIWGTIIGVLIMGVINNGLQLLGAQYDMQCIVKGAIIVFAIVLDSWVSRRE